MYICVCQEGEKEIRRYDPLILHHFWTYPAVWQNSHGSCSELLEKGLKNSVLIQIPLKITETFFLEDLVHALHFINTQKENRVSIDELKGLKNQSLIESQ